MKSHKNKLMSFEREACEILNYTVIEIRHLADPRNDKTMLHFKP